MLYIYSLTSVAFILYILHFSHKLRSRSVLRFSFRLVLCNTFDFCKHFSRGCLFTRLNINYCFRLLLTIFIFSSIIGINLFGVIRFFFRGNIYNKAHTQNGKRNACCVARQAEHVLDFGMRPDAGKLRSSAGGF